MDYSKLMEISPGLTRKLREIDEAIERLAKSAAHWMNIFVGLEMEVKRLQVKVEGGDHK